MSKGVTDTYPKWIYLDSHIVAQWVMDYNIDFPDSLVTERKVGTVKHFVLIGA